MSTTTADDLPVDASPDDLPGMAACEGPGATQSAAGPAEVGQGAPGVMPPVMEPMRAATDADLPTTAKRMIRHLAPGWRYRATYSRGPAEIGRIVDHRRVREWVIVESVAVRFEHASGIAAVCCWNAGRTDYVSTWLVCRDQATCGCTREGHPVTCPRTTTVGMVEALVTVAREARKAA